MKAPDPEDVLAAAGLAALVAGVWIEFTLGWSLVVGGAVVLFAILLPVMRGAAAGTPTKRTP